MFPGTKSTRLEVPQDTKPGYTEEDIRDAYLATEEQLHSLELENEQLRNELAQLLAG